VEEIELSAGLAEVLGLPTRSSRQQAAAALAAVAELPAPARQATQNVLAEIVIAVQRHVIDEPEVPLDRAMAAHFALSYGCLTAGPEQVRDALGELGSDALDTHVRAALHSTIAPALAARGLLYLVGG
jgi:hypothetical protein